MTLFMALSSVLLREPCSSPRLVGRAAEGSQRPSLGLEILGVGILQLGKGTPELKERERGEISRVLRVFSPPDWSPGPDQGEREISFSFPKMWHGSL